MSTDSRSLLHGLSDPPELEFSVRMDARSSTVVLRGELDGETSCLVAGVVDAQIGHGHVHLRVDVGEVAFIDLDGFDALREADDRLRDHGGGLVVVRWGRIVECLAAVSGAEHLLDDGRDGARRSEAGASSASGATAPADG
jgi:anti-anti-sigma factor